MTYMKNWYLTCKYRTWFHTKNLWKKQLLQTILNWWWARRHTYIYTPNVQDFKMPPNLSKFYLQALDNSCIHSNSFYLFTDFLFKLQYPSCKLYWEIYANCYYGFWRHLEQNGRMTNDCKYLAFPMYSCKTKNCSNIFGMYYCYLSLSEHQNCSSWREKPQVNLAFSRSSGKTPLKSTVFLFMHKAHLFFSN